VIVGRGITRAENPAQTAREYAETAYGAYLKRVA